MASSNASHIAKSSLKTQNEWDKYLGLGPLMDL